MIRGQLLNVKCQLLSLALFMLRVFLANNINTTKSSYDFAIITHFFYRWSYFHFNFKFEIRNLISILTLSPIKILILLSFILPDKNPVISRPSSKITLKKALGRASITLPSSLVIFFKSSFFLDEEEL